MFHSPAWLRKSCPQRDFLLALGAVIIAACAIWYFRTRDLVEAGAYFGFSPVWLADPLAALGHGKAHDFPTAESDLLRSLPMLLYPLGARLGLSGTHIFYFTLTLEILSLVVGSIVATRLLRPQAPPIAGLLVAMCLMASTIMNCDLARWEQPYYGEVYNYAYGFGMCGTALMIVGRLRSGAVLLALSIVTHPILGLLCTAFTAVAMLADLRRYNWRALAEASVIIVVLVSGWLAIAMQGAGITGGAVPPDLFVGITKIMGYHWYPVTIGVFTTLHWEGLIPFTTMCLLLTIFLFNDKERLTGLERQLAAGFLGLLVIVAIGVFNAELSGVPFLIKLALHRASTIFLLMAVVVIVPGLWRDITEGPLVRATLALLIMVAPFATRHGVPALLGIALATMVLFENLRGNPRSQWSIATLLALAIVLILPVLIAVNGLWVAASTEVYTANKTLTALAWWPLAIAIVLIGIGVLFRARPAIVVLVGLAALYWSPNVKPFQSQAELMQARDYTSVQRWARDSTPLQTLFMPDPVHAYGWREVSERPSFGSVREWLYTAFVYDTHKDIFDEGLKRFSELGLNIGEYLKMYSNSARDRIISDVRRRYYSADAAWFAHIHRTYGVAYFVFEKSHLDGRPPIPVVYENASYVVGQSS